MINILFPFLLLSIISIFFSKKNNISLTKSFLICILSLPFFIFLIGNFIQLYYGVYLISVFILLLIFIHIFFYKKKLEITFYLKDFLLIYLPIFVLLILYSYNLTFYKYDEFSEYGIVSKLLFYEEKNLNNIHNIFNKGSPHKINIMGYLNYFFLKTSFLSYKEQLVYIAQNTLNLILIINILEFLSQKQKKIIFFIIIYLLSFVLSTGFDKVYLDITAGLLIALIILNQNLNPQKNKYLIIALCMLFLFCLKNSTSLIFFGLALIFILISIISKNYKIVFFYLLIIFCSFLIEKIYSSNLYLFKTENNFDVENFYANNTKILSYENKIDSSLLFLKNFENKKFEKILKRNFELLSQKGVYHAKTFLIPNKILDRLNINFNLIEIPLNIFIWFMFILILSKIVNIEDKNQLYIFISLFIVFIIFYWLTILIWGWQNNLVNTDYSVEVSWQRHLGTLVFGLVIYLSVILFKYNNLNYVKYFLILLFLFNISMPNSLKNFFTKEFIMKNNFWSEKYNQRIEIKDFSKLISDNLKPYSTLIYSLDNKDSYFYPILNYELINISLIKMDELNDLYLVSENHDKDYLYLLINKEKESLIKKYNVNEKINFSKLFSDSKIMIFKLSQT